MFKILGWGLMNGPNKLDHYITLGWKGLPGTITLAYWIHSILESKCSVVDMHPAATQLLSAQNAGLFGN
jgi:hypothetical protein